jgi:methylated-DNA-[protein]-cysteine S-methyltransferase
MNRIKRRYFKTPYGELVLGAFDGKLCLCDWRYRNMRDAIDKRLAKGLKAVFFEADDAVLEHTRRQLEEYFGWKRKAFDIPLCLMGTDFQKRVWEELMRIPFGATITYSELAERVGRETAVRAVAGANGANPISIVIPCHRIIGSDGRLVGYAGGLRTKEKLLSLENNLFMR